MQPVLPAQMSDRFPLHESSQRPGNRRRGDVNPATRLDPASAGKGSSVEGNV